MKKRTKPAKDDGPNDTVVVEQTPDETGAQAMARKVLEPHLRHALTASAFAGKVLGKNIEGPGLMDYIRHEEVVTAKAEAGDLAIASRLLVAQAVTLDSMFTELARRAALNMNDYIDAAERYGRLALKAQSNSRATLEALVKIHQPREQTVKHVHVNEGGQAVVADQFHQHNKGVENEKSGKQSHATVATGESSAMLGDDPQGNGVPISSREGAEAVQDARRD
jgi:hypothetical protein